MRSTSYICSSPEPRQSSEPSHKCPPPPPPPRPPPPTCPAPDFFEYFSAMAPFLDRDETLMAVSAWNDNGQAQHVKVIRLGKRVGCTRRIVGQMARLGKRVGCTSPVVGRKGESCLGGRPAGPVRPPTCCLPRIRNETKRNETDRNNAKQNETNRSRRIRRKNET